MTSRIERLRELLDEPLLVTNLVNVLYLTGFESSNAALLVPPKGEPTLYTDFRYTESANAVPGVQVEITKRAATRSETTDLRRHSSRSSTLDRCTSTIGIVSDSRASWIAHA